MWPSFQLKNITLHFFLLVCSSFSRYYVCKQCSAFRAASFGDLLLNEKQKKPFVSLKDEVTITQSFFTAASLAQVDKAPNEADVNSFCHDTQGLDLRSVKSFFFFVLFLTRGYAKRRNGFLLGLRYANVSLAHSGVESS